MSILIIAAIIPIVGILVKKIKKNIVDNKTEKIIKSIDADELTRGLISEFKNSDFNINDGSVSTKFVKYQDMDEDTLKLCSYDSNPKNSKTYNNFICAFITDKNKKCVGIPLFKIEEDGGKLRKIEMVGTYTWFYRNDVETIIMDYMIKEYGIDKSVAHSYLNNKFMGPARKPAIIRSRYLHII